MASAIIGVAGSRAAFCFVDLMFVQNTTIYVGISPKAAFEG